MEHHPPALDYQDLLRSRLLSELHSSKDSAPLPSWYTYALEYHGMDDLHMRPRLVGFHGHGDRHLREKGFASARMLADKIQRGEHLTTADLNTCGLWQPAILAAADAGDVQGVKWLLLSGSRRAISTGRWFVARIAVKNGNTQLVREMLKGERSYGVNCLWPYIVWRFMLSETAGTLEDPEDENIQLLLQSTLPKTFKDYYGWTFLHYAAVFGDLACVEKLLEEGNTMQLHVDLCTSIRHKEGFTALHLAAYYNYEDIVMHLLHKHADVNKRDTARSRTPLHYAVEQGSLLAVKALLQSKNIDVDAVDAHGMSPLHLAASKPHAEIVGELIGRTKHPNLKALPGYKQQMLLNVLLPIKKEFSKVSPLSFYGSQFQWASSECCPKPNILEPMLWYPEGFTALHFAIAYGRSTKTAQILLRSGRLTEALEDSEGLTAFDWAVAMSLPVSEEVFLSSNIFNCHKLHDFRKQKAAALYHELVRKEQARQKLQWSIEIRDALATRQWHTARYLASQAVEIDVGTWELLEETLKAAFISARSVPFQPSVVESILLQLLRGGNVSWSMSACRRCLMWAMRFHMVLVAEELVRGKCQLLSTVPGSFDDTLTPLEYATSLRNQWPELLTAMEQREDVRRALYEDRQVYVDYANALLVGAALIASLAYQGWLQPPLGYLESHIDLEGSDMRVFAKCNALGFFFAMGALLAGAAGSIPLPSGQLANTKANVHRAVILASLLLALSVAFLVIAFSTAGMAVLSHDIVEPSFFHACSACVAIILVWFLSRLDSLTSLSTLVYYFGVALVNKFLRGRIMYKFRDICAKTDSRNISREPQQSSF